VVIQPNPTVNGCGHYEDEYVEVDGKWKKKVSKKHDSVKSRLRPSVK
jgi:hypothetical protein